MKKLIITLSILLVGAAAFAIQKYLPVMQGEKKAKVTTQNSQQSANGQTSQLSPANANYNSPAINNMQVLPAVLRIRAFDVGTGINVLPDLIELCEDEGNCRPMPLKYDTTDGGVLIKANNGTHNITVKAPGYRPMETYFTVNNDSLNANFYLEPITPVMQLTSNYLQALHSRYGMVVVGYITNKTTGKPIAGVSVYTEDKYVSVVSGANGYFEMSIPLVDSAVQAASRGKIHFEKQGYAVEVRSNFDMWPYGDMILQVQLQVGSGLNTDELIKKREASYVTKTEADAYQEK